MKDAEEFYNTNCPLTGVYEDGENIWFSKEAMIGFAEAYAKERSVEFLTQLEEKGKIIVTEE